MGRRAPLHRSSSIAILAGAFLLASHPVDAATVVCPPATYQLWTAPAGATFGPASAPSNDTAFSPVAGRSRSYVTQGTELLTYYNNDFPQGCTPGTGNACAPTGGTCTRLKGCKLPSWTTSPPSVLGAPTVVPSSRDSSKAYVFVGAQDGRLYRLDVSGEPAYPTISVDTRRPSCASDRAVAAPAVQLYSFSNSTFKNQVDSLPGH